jgi:hypothetical protein
MFSEGFGAFLGGATEQNLPADASPEAIWMLNEAYETTYDSFRKGHAFMFGIGETISTQVLEQFGYTIMREDGGETPSDMLKTGMGGATYNTSPWACVLVFCCDDSVSGSLDVPQKFG